MNFENLINFGLEFLDTHNYVAIVSFVALCLFTYFKVKAILKIVAIALVFGIVFFIFYLYTAKRRIREYHKRITFLIRAYKVSIEHPAIRRSWWQIYSVQPFYPAICMHRWSIRLSCYYYIGFQFLSTAKSNGLSGQFEELQWPWAKYIRFNEAPSRILLITNKPSSDVIPKEALKISSIYWNRM